MIKLFPISRDPPEGGTAIANLIRSRRFESGFPISRDPPEGGTGVSTSMAPCVPSFQFLGIPPKGELRTIGNKTFYWNLFPISRDPPEGGTFELDGGIIKPKEVNAKCFQFLGIPPKGEPALALSIKKK